MRLAALAVIVWALLTGCAADVRPAPPLPTSTPASTPSRSALDWQRLDEGIPPYTFVTSFLATPDGWWAGAYDRVGLWYSPDEGASWRAEEALPAPVYALARTEQTRWAATSGGLWRDDGDGWEAQPGIPDGEVLDVSADGDTVVVALGVGGLARVDGERATLIAAPPAAVTPQTGALSVAARGDWLLLGSSGAGVWQSYDGGATWQQLPFDERGFAAHVAFSGDSAWVQTREGLWRSTDGGQRWDRWSDEQYTALLPSGDGILVGTKNGRVLRSRDGRTWEPVGEGLNARLPVVTLADGPSGTLVAGLQDGLWRLSEERWERKDLFGTTRIEAVAALPDGTLLAGHRDGVYRRTAGHWELSSLGGLAATVLAPDPHDPHGVYAGTDGAGVWYSDDEGLSWRRLRAGADILLVTGLYPDPEEPGTVVAQVAYDRLYEWSGMPPRWRPIWDGIRVESEVFDLLRDPDSEASWAGVSDGLVLREADNAAWRYVADALGDQSVLDIQPVGEDLWLGTTRGLYRVDGESGRLSGRATAVPDIGISRVTPLADGRWLFGTPLQGLYSLGGDHWLREPLPVEAVTQIVDLGDGVLAATDDGLWQAGVSPSDAAPLPEIAPLPPTPDGLATPESTAGEAVGLRLYAHLLNPTEELFRIAAGSGFTGVVVLLPWREIEPNPDEWHWERADSWLHAAQYYGLEVVVRLDQSPMWATTTQDGESDGSLNPLPASWQDYAEYAARVAGRYRGRVEGYVLWNEPNLALDWGGVPPDPAAYVDLLRAAAPALRAADPGTLVVAGALAPTTRDDAAAMDDLRYLNAMLEAGAGDFFDVLAVHPYPFGLPPAADSGDNGGLNLARLERVEALMARYGLGDRPLWATEFGYSVANSPFGPPVTTAERQAYLRDALTLFPRRFPTVQMLALWNLADGLPASDEKAGFNLAADRSALELARAFESPRSRTRSLPPPVALAADVKIHLGDSELPPPWWPLYAGENPSVRWEGGFYLDEAPSGAQTLLLEAYQWNERGNRLAVNGVKLHHAPLPVTDFRSQWLTVRIEVPAGVLRAGWNEVTFEIGHIVPVFQQRRYVWDDVQIRNVRLAP